MLCRIQCDEKNQPTDNFKWEYILLEQHTPMYIYIYICVYIYIYIYIYIPPTLKYIVCFPDIPMFGVSKDICKNNEPVTIDKSALIYVWGRASKLIVFH